MTEPVKTPFYSFALIQPPPSISFPYHFTFRMCFIDILYITFSADIDIAVETRCVDSKFNQVYISRVPRFAFGRLGWGT